MPAGFRVPTRETLRRSVGPLLWGLAVTLVVAYGTYLRLDALVGKYGPFTHPAWMVSMQDSVLATREDVVPRGWSWTKKESPYGRGDPVTYIRFAREMQSFYQAHVREPVFLVVTRFFISLADDQDIGVSLASASFSVLLVLAIFLLGSAVASRWVGLGAASLAAVEGELVAWAPEGWRDDAFAALVTLSGWAFVLMYRRRTWGHAVLLGVIGAVACLTRITSLSFLVPGFAVLLVTSDRTSWRRDVSRVCASAMLLGALVAPYLINCYRATGDPLFAINEHTRFYRAAEGQSYDKPMSASAYTIGKFQQMPITETDRALRGLFLYPMSIKFRAFAPWPPLVGTVLKWLAVFGLFLWLWQPVGRLLLVLLFASLVPYMLTWAIPGGAEWRFTMHTYGFYLVASVGSVWSITGLLIRSWSADRFKAWWSDHAARRRVALRSLTAVVLWLVASGWYYRGPALVLAESLRTGEAESLHAGPNDEIFFREGWSSFSTTGAVVSRFATSLESVVYVPLPDRRPYRLVLRMDPLPSMAEPPQRVQVRLESHLVAEVDLALNPERVGSYAVLVPVELTGEPLSRLTLTARELRPAGADAEPYSGITPDTEVAFFLWYIRIIPE